jgi:hypothetical protein
MVAVMAKIIAFYVPDTFRGVRIQRPPERRGKVIEFPSTETRGVTSQLNRGEPPLCSQCMVPLTAVCEKKEETSRESPIKRLWVIRPEGARP